MFEKYDPKIANLPILELIVHRGVGAAIHSAVFVVIFYGINYFLGSFQGLGIGSYIFFFIFGTIYETIKPKIVREIRGFTMGKEWRDKSDDEYKDNDENK